MKKRHQNKRNTKTNQGDEVPNKRRRNEKRESAEEGPSLASNTAKENPTSTPKNLPDQRGSKRPRADVPDSSQRAKRNMAVYQMEKRVSSSGADRPSHVKRKREENVSAKKESKTKKTSAGVSTKNRGSLPQATAGVSGTRSHSTSETLTASLSLESFSFHKMIGEGSYGKVMLASHASTKTKLAVKMVKKRKLIEDPRDIVLIERQVLEKTGQSIFFTHAYATFQTADYVFFTMEYLSGGNLQEFIELRAPLDFPTTRFLAAEMICGLQFLHVRGIIHRDIKPDNILLDSVGHIKIADFGLAATNIFGDRKISERAGTVGYMAPEICLRKPYNTTVDWFSFGVILYEMATGTYPFYTGKKSTRIEQSVVYDTPSYPNKLNPHIRDIIEQLLSKSPLKRQKFCQSIRQHRFFSKMSWVELEAGRTPPPFEIEPKPVKELNKKIAVRDLLSSGEAEKSPISAEHQGLFCGFSFVSPRWRSMEKKSS